MVSLASFDARPEPSEENEVAASFVSIFSRPPDRIAALIGPQLLDEAIADRVTALQSWLVPQRRGQFG